MQLSRHGRENYILTITTTPAIAAWEASFDGGTTWFAGTATGTVNQFRWLIAGPSASAGTAVAVLAVGGHSVLVRATDTPEIVIRDAPSISVT